MDLPAIPRWTPPPAANPPDVPGGALARFIWRLRYTAILMYRTDMPWRPAWGSSASAWDDDVPKTPAEAVGDELECWDDDGETGT